MQAGARRLGGRSRAQRRLPPHRQEGPLLHGARHPRARRRLVRGARSGTRRRANKPSTILREGCCEYDAVPIESVQQSFGVPRNATSYQCARRVLWFGGFGLEVTDRLNACVQTNQSLCVHGCVTFDMVLVFAFVSSTKRSSACNILEPKMLQVDELGCFYLSTSRNFVPESDCIFTQITPRFFDVDVQRSADCPKRQTGCNYLNSTLCDVLRVSHLVHEFSPLAYKKGNAACDSINMAPHMFPYVALSLYVCVWLRVCAHSVRMCTDATNRWASYPIVYGFTSILYDRLAAMQRVEQPVPTDVPSLQSVCMCVCTYFCRTRCCTSPPCQSPSFV